MQGMRSIPKRSRLMKIVDVWDVSTFDDPLAAKLREHTALVRDYLTTSRRQYIERELSDHTQPYAINSFATEYGAFVEGIGRMMEARTIRAWHYCRLTDSEAEALRRNGIQLSTIDTLTARLNAQVAAGSLSRAEAHGLFAASPFHSVQREARTDKYWMVSTPLPPDYSGVQLLLRHWGGEVAYFWLRDQDLVGLVQGIGRGRVIEVAVPMSATRHSYSAGSAVVATFARSLGCKPDRMSFDLYTTKRLGADAILRIHSEGESDFAALGSVYPLGSADPTIDDYDELVAEMQAIRSAQ